MTYPTIEAMLGPDVRLEPMSKHVDSLSGSAFEVAITPTRRYLVKHIHRDLDWLMRLLGDGVDGARPRALIVWQEGLLDALPPVLAHCIEGMVYDPGTGLLRQVMRDAGDTLVPADGSLVPLSQHRRFLDHLAALHATFWGFRDGIGLTTAVQRYGFAHPSHAGTEHDPVPSMFPAGWAAVAEVSPELARPSLALIADASPLAAAMADGPHTFVHGDWKFGNLGSHPDGRTVLLDWGWPGEAGPAVDLAWYLAVNCDRLPESKEDSIEAYRTALERHGIPTRDWWDRHLSLALLGGFLQLGWSKSGPELTWWLDRTLPLLTGEFSVETRKTHRSLGS
jgi:hypothetical protein